MHRSFYSAFLSVAISVSCLTAVHAAPATAEQAAQIKAGLERYLGHGGDGGPVTVSPAGDAYKIQIDIKKTLHVLETFGAVFDSAVYTLTAEPNADGTWHVTSGSMPPLTVKFGDQTTSIVANGQHFDGVFDPRIPAFRQFAAGYDSLSIGIVGKKVATQARQLNHGQQTFTATSPNEGVVDLHLSQTNSDFAQDMAFDNPKNSKTTIPTKFSIKSGPTAEGVGADGLRIRALADLWAFFVAHPSLDSIKASLSDLKTALRQALPLFQHWSQDGSFDMMNVDSAVGNIRAKAVSGHIDLDGVNASGHANLALKVDGLVTPTAKLPAWTTDLIPTAFEIRNSFSGFRLDQAAQEAINDFDLNTPQPLAPETVDKLKTLLGPTDQMVLSIGASRITSPLIDARFEGAVHFTQPLPSYTVTVHATGLDKAIQAIQAKGAKDPTAAQAIAGMMLVKGYGKADPDGSVTWVVAGNPTGTITVNDVELPIGKGQ